MNSFLKVFLKNWRIGVFFLVVFAAFFSLVLTGLNFGIDFKGGTLFQVQFSEPIKDNVEMERIRSVIEQRVNVTGLKDISVYSVGNRFILVQTPESDPEQIERIEALLRKQGRFEVRIDGKTVFTGKNVANVDQSTQISAFNSLGNGLTGWNLPFTLDFEGAKNFRDSVFHKCTLLNASSNPTQSDFDCAYTYFFIDRPLNSFFVLSKEDFEKDKALFLTGNPVANVPAGIDIQEVILNLGGKVFSFDSIDENALDKIFSGIEKEKTAIVSGSFSEEEISFLKKEFIEKNVRVKVFERQKDVPWLWSVSGLRSVVRLNPSITGNLKFVDSPEKAPINTNLIITGSSPDLKLAELERGETKVILQSGSLPVSVEDISKESISPALGENFKFQVLTIGVLVILIVSMIIFFRYRLLGLSIAIIFVSLSEAFVTLSFSSLFGTIDLAAMTGIIATVGTGVDSQIVITDELLRKKRKEVTMSVLARFKRAFFIIAASATTIFATMLPLVLYSSVLIKLRGFAIAIMVGVLVGVLITRPAYGEIAKLLISDRENWKRKNK